MSGSPPRIGKRFRGFLPVVVDVEDDKLILRHKDSSGEPGTVTEEATPV